MSENRIFLDPTSEQDPDRRQRQVRPDSLDGKTVGVLDISKARGNVFLDRLDSLLSERGITVNRYMKPTFARPAPTDLLQQISTECDVVVEGLAD
jgi:hypothetical protein